MKLYHFTSNKHIDGINRRGIVLGHIPFLIAPGKIRLVPGYQWLTSNGDFEQSWSVGPEEGSRPNYRRTDFRITVELPLLDARLHNWLKFCQQKHMQLTAKTLNEFGDPQNWWVYEGTITPDKFVAVDENPIPSPFQIKG